MTKSEEEKVLASFGITRNQLPKINSDDVVVKDIGAKEGEVIKIIRNDETGKNTYYRLVVKA